MAQLISPSSISSFWRGKSSSLDEIEVLMNLLPQAAMLFDRQRNIFLTANSEFLKLTAYTLKEIQGRSAADIVPDLDPKQLTGNFESTFSLNRRRRETAIVNLKATALDSEQQRFILMFEPVRSQPVNTEHLRAEIFQVILELIQQIDTRQPQLLLERAVQMVGSTLHATQVCIYQADPNYPRLNKMATNEMQVVYPENISSADLIRLSAPDIWTPGKRVFNELHRSGRVANLSYIASAPLGQEGAIFGLLVVGDSESQPLDNLAEFLQFYGELIGIVLQECMLIDNLHSESGKQKNELIIRNALMDSVQEGVLVVSPTLNITGINPAAELMLGYADWEVWGQTVENILIGPAGLLPALEAAAKGMPTLNLGSAAVHRRSGQIFPAHIQTVPVMEDGEVRAILVIMTDISENEEIRVRTQQLEHRAMLGDITAIFAHEVRNPINNISMGAQVLSNKLNSEDPNQDIIQRILSDCGRLEHLMESVLASSRPLESSFKPLDIHQLLQRILDRWQPRFSRVNVRPFYQAAEHLPKIYGDNRSLEQVFTNLISNSVEVMNKTGGTLAIHVQPSDIIPNRPQIEVTVSDNGPGIPDDIRDRVFDPFVSSNPRGTGLGLAITKRIVTAHQGSIQVNSFPGGTVFHVYLPVYNGD